MRADLLAGSSSQISRPVSNQGPLKPAQEAPVHVASRRVREIGVRKSSGARTSQIVVMLIRDFSKPVLIANVVAWPLAYFAAQQYLSVFMHRIPLTPVPFGLSLALALAIAWIAVGGQAVRAARASPATVLRVD